MRFKANSLVIKSLTLFMGVAIALLSLSSPSIPFHKSVEKKVKKEQTDQQHDSGDNTDSAYVLFGDMSSHVTNIHVQPLLKWIRDIELVDNPVVHLHEMLENSTTPFFQTLFRQIISPNAP